MTEINESDGGSKNEQIISNKLLEMVGDQQDSVEDEYQSFSDWMRVKGRSHVEDEITTDSYIPESDFLEIEKRTIDELREKVFQTLESRQLRSMKKQVGETIAAQSDALRYRNGISIDASSTDELRKVQEQVEIPEQVVRELQTDAGLERLYPSRREEFLKQILDERVKARGAALVDDEEIRTEAREEIARLFEETGDVVEMTWKLWDSGSFSGNHRETDEADMVVLIQHATGDLSETSLRRRAADIVVLEDEAKMVVVSPFGRELLTLSRGAYKIRARSIRTLAEEAGLIRAEKRAASCESSDKAALDIEFDEAENTAQVVELKSGDGGYSRRYTETWTLYRDFDLGREMVLITVGQKSFYGRSFRGKQERTWLIGRDEGKVWTHQVYNTHQTIEEALAFMKPAEVKRLEAEGRQVIRQGDVYFVELIQHSNFDALEETRHDVVQGSDGEVVITHPEHEDLELTGEWKAVLNNDGSRSQPSRHRHRTARD